MAIIIQEEKKGSNLTVIIAALIVLAGGGALTYYLFFSPVPLAEKLDGTAKFQTVSKFSEARIDIDKITGSSVWKSLTRPGSVPPLTTQLPSRRSNPFESF